jgi:hypothetical protein
LIYAGRVTRIVMVMLALCACSRTLWHETDPRRVKRGDQVFVVASGQAAVYEITASDRDSIRGEPVRAWTFEPGRITVRERETPEATARRLGWSPKVPEQAPRELRVDKIAFVSEPREPDQYGPIKTILGAAVFLGVTVLVFGAAFGVAVTH